MEPLILWLVMMCCAVFCFARLVSDYRRRERTRVASLQYLCRREMDFFRQKWGEQKC